MEQNQVYAIYRQLHPVTGIEHCVYCNFIDIHKKNLVVAAVNQLLVYRLCADSDNVQVTAHIDKATEKTQDVRAKRMRLECIATFSLFGNVMSMQSVRLAGSMQDSLILSFPEAKLSIVEYDPATHDLKTCSMHCFEDYSLKEGHCQQAEIIPTVQVDPDNRCCAMLVYGQQLVVLPFKRDLLVDTAEEAAANGSQPPVMSSYVIPLHKLDEKITNVIDFQFLHGYYEPTVLVLYEPLPTWSGRLAMRRDTCCIVALSLNLLQKVHPIIWSLSNLPYDCCKVVAVPKPIGGVLVFAVNSLLYLNQSQPPCGVSLNSITNGSTDFLLKIQESVKISLDCTQASFIAGDKLVTSLRGGELYVLTLLTDGMRIVRNFHLDKAAASVLATCMCTCDDGYLFLGSRLGNSVLLKYAEKQSESTTSDVSSQKQDKDEPMTKKWKAADTYDDLDELEVYGSSSSQLGSQITHYVFEACDSLVNIGPCGQIVMGEPAFLSEEFHNPDNIDIELVITSGYGKNGAISVVQRSIRPQVVTTFELSGCTDMWTVVGDKQESSTDQGDEDESGDGQTHSFLILSREDSSMVLKTGHEIMELDQSGLNTHQPTVFAGNIGHNRYIFQVSAHGVRLLEGVKMIHHIPLDGSQVVTCSVADPYIVLLTEDGHVIIAQLKVDTQGGNARLMPTKPRDAQASRIVTLCAYKDVSGLFTLTSDKTAQLRVATVRSSRMSVETPAKATPANLLGSTVDDEDELLYGGSTTKSESEAQQLDLSSDNSKPSQEEDIQPTYWVAVVRENGVLEIFSLPNFESCFRVKNFPVSPNVLVDVSDLISSEKDGSNSFDSKGGALHETLTVREILLVALGNNKSRPHLMARINEDLLIYELFPYHGTSKHSSRLKIRFKKFNHGVIIGHKKQVNTRTGAKQGQDSDPTKEELSRSRNRWLQPFDDISGYSGVFVCGPYPHWILMTARGCLRIHPMSVDGPVTCFTPFHNVNCPKGFLYFNQQGELRICILPTHLSHDAPWPVRKVTLRATPYYVAYHTESKTYGIVTSTSEPCTKLVQVVGDGDKEFEQAERDDRFIYPMLEKFSVQLYSPATWEPIPNTRFEFEEFERVTCMHSVSLKSEGTVSGLKPFVAIATTYAYSEDVTCRGRIVIYDVIEVVPEPGQPLTKNKMKIVYNKEQKGPVSALQAVQGFLVTAIGQKIYIWQLKDDDLCGVAFIDTQVYVHSIITIKNLILVGDIFKSVTLLRYQEDMKVLSLVSRDARHLEVYGIAFMVDNINLNFAVSDRQKNVFIYSYAPLERESHGGQLLLRRSCINVGSHINSFFRIRCKSRDIEKRASSRIEKRQTTYFATLDGSIGYLLPVTEKVYRRLSMLQNLLNTYIPHLAGLNPKSYRMMEQEVKNLSQPVKPILDGDLIWKFLSLPAIERAELAKRMVTTVDQIMSDLMEIDRTTSHF